MTYHTRRHMIFEALHIDLDESRSDFLSVKYRLVLHS